MLKDSFRPEEVDIEIREMKLKDIDEVMKIERSVFSYPWSEQVFFSELLSSRPSHYLVAVSGDRPVGYGGARLELNRLHIVNLAVDVAWQRCGVGGMLLRKFISLAGAENMGEIYLEVRESNTAALSFYEEFDFVQKKKRYGYYQNNNENAIVMVRRLDNNE